MEVIDFQLYKAWTNQTNLTELEELLIPFTRKLLTVVEPLPLFFWFMFRVLRHSFVMKVLLGFYVPVHTTYALLLLFAVAHVAYVTDPTGTSLKVLVAMWGFVLSYGWGYRQHDLSVREDVCTIGSILPYFVFPDHYSFFFYSVDFMCFYLLCGLIFCNFCYN